MKYNRLFVALLLGMFLISFASAGLLQSNLEYVNNTNSTNQTNNSYGQYNLHENGGFLGLFQGDKIQTFKLLDSQNSVINAWAILNVTNYRNESLLDQLEFKGGSVKDFNLTYLVNESYTIPTYQTICHNETIPFNETNTTTNLTNSTREVCSQTQNGTITKYRQVWKPYNKEILPIGSYKLRIDGKLGKVNHAVDWVLNKNGEKLDKWQWWNSLWDYKRQIDLTANSGQFSYLATINYDPHMNSDFSDIRFVNGAEDTEFKYTIEKKTNGVNATVRIYSQGETTFYMYYGNSGATTTSSASNTYFNPIDMYYLDDNANDFVGTNDGTISGATATTGKIGGAYSFDGSTNYIQLFNSLPSEAFSLSAWVKIGTTGTNKIVLDKESATSFTYPERDFQLQISNSNNLQFLISDGSHWAVILQSPSTLSSGTWYYVTATNSGTQQKLYINGVEDASSSVSFTRQKTSNPLLIGRNYQYGNYMDGTIDEVGIWDKALTSTQISDLYQQTAPTYTVGSEQSNSKYFNKYSNAEILIAGNKITKLGTGRIEIDDLQQVYDGLGRLKVNSEITKEGQSRINLSSAFTKNSNAKIFKREKIERTGKSSIRILGLSFNKEGNAFVSNRSTFEKTGNSKIVLFGRQFLKDSQTRIQIKNLSFTKEGKSRILKGYSFEKTGTSEVVLRQTIEKIGKSYVVMLDKYQPKIKSINYLPPKIKSIETFN